MIYNTKYITGLEIATNDLYDSGDGIYELRLKVYSANDRSHTQSIQDIGVVYLKNEISFLDEKFKPLKRAIQATEESIRLFILGRDFVSEIDLVELFNSQIRNNLNKEGFKIGSV